MSKPIVTVWECDESKGGASIRDLRDECERFCVDDAPPSYPEYRGPEEVLAAVFANSPIRWVRATLFQLESIKQVAHNLLLHLPHYMQHPAMLSRGLRIGRERPLHFSSPTTLLVCNSNAGAWDVAREIVAEAKTSMLRVVEAEGVLPERRRRLHSFLRLGIAGPPLPTGSMLFLYLNYDTFHDEGANLAAIVKRALDLKLPTVLAHEQDMERGGCHFAQCIEHTPKALCARLYDTIAVPLYPEPGHRDVSIRGILASMGATPKLLRTLSRIALRRQRHPTDPSMSRGRLGSAKWGRKRTAGTGASSSGGDSGAVGARAAAAHAV